MNAIQPENQEQLDGAARGPRPAACVAVLLAMWAVLYLPALHSLPLLDPEESRCAVIVQNMLRSGDWLVPTLDARLRDGVATAVPYYDKPAPFFWLAAGLQKLTGSIELSGRLAAAVAALVAILATFGIARRIGGNLAGLLAGVVLATSPLFFFLGRYYRMDMPFTAAMTAALWFFWAGRAARRRWLWWLGFYAMCAAAVLLKGPAGMILPLAVAGLYLVVADRLAGAGEGLLFLLPGLALVAVLAGPFYAAAMQHDPQYFQKFIIEQNFARFSKAGAVDVHTFSPLLYLVIAAAGVGLWAVYLAGGLMRTFPLRLARRPLRARLADRRTLFAWLGFAVPLAFFMAASTRMVHYILPVFPFLAVIIALPLARWAGQSERDELYRHGARAATAMMAGLLVMVGGTEFLLPKFIAVFRESQKLSLAQWLSLRELSLLNAWFIPFAAGMILCVIAMWRSLRLQRRGALLGCAAAGLVMTLLFLTLEPGPRYYAQSSSRDLAVQARSHIAKDDKFAFWRRTSYSFELYAGLGSSPELAPAHPEDIQYLTQQRPLVLIPASSRHHENALDMNLAELQRLTGIKFTVLAQDSESALARPTR